MHFYTLKEAAAAIAAKIHPSDDKNFADATRCYVAALDNAVGTNGIVYRDPVTRLPLQRAGIAASLAAHSCVVSERDLNAWLDSQGVGIQIRSSALDDGEASERSADGNDFQPESESAAVEDAASTEAKPTSAELASSLGPYLSNGHDIEWFNRRLNDADRYLRLKKYRSVEGKRPVARWEVGGVVLHLIESGEMTRKRAKEALAAHYPQHLYVLDSPAPEQAKPVAAEWIPHGIL